MIDYIKSILPRIQQYSKQLSDVSNFVDIPWAFIDEQGSKVIYLFRRNNTLMVSVADDIAEGKWEYLSMLNSLVIEYDNRKRLYNQGFLDKAVMILKKDGSDQVLVLINYRDYPDLDINLYLKSKEEKEQAHIKNLELKQDIQDRNAKIVILKNGREVLLKSNKPSYNILYSYPTATFYDSMETLPDGEYRTDDDIRFS